MTAPEFPEVELALISKAISGDAGGLYRIASGLMEKGVPFDSILFDYLLATERSVGQRWAQGDYLVAEEHAVTAAIETVISLLAGMFDQPADGQPVVVATAEGDNHSLPARAAAAHLLYLGFRTTFLGANVPGSGLGDFLDGDPPVALVLSVAMTTHLLGARSVVAPAHEAGVPVLVGGKAFGSDGRWAPAVGADAYVTTLRDVPEVIDGWVANGAPELAAMPTLAPGLAALVANRPAILARFEMAPGAEAVRLADEARLTLGSVEAGLLTGDDQVIADMLRWQREYLPAHGLQPQLVVDAVVRALDGVSEEGTAALQRALHFD